ncbi:3-deoxy-manno-octulosonate cytidylyltransferase [Leptospira perolatii]|uniref:3-deoxy-manno-octulosonate cytidylyltransferase n=1 Tax=Leptospira perolatii TaxID=2023191 RepID=A0A2M9ZLJ5_9LEPT|nr:3-deoxy-manno-octulosonate cytidylyltransferase [Leptospira perolatii]PJZ70303.1 3-deoxy-manno-octulosonate cytidylyltransferase [Leptospira perolatii]PJZ72813.1 3-deoxy-manno-octulosonate cytidylyltransferase [Leptospira perolatii]
MNTVAIIPARMASTRFPGKPLADIHGVPMIGHLFHRCKKSTLINEVYVATCDLEIKSYIESQGGIAIMTSDKHERASDRTAEAMFAIEKLTGRTIDVVAMVQGDEPMITPEILNRMVQPFIDDSNVSVVNLMADLLNKKEQEDANEVKVVTDLADNALYFSREPIPSWKKGGENLRMLKQLGLISFKKEYLLKFNSLPQTPLEIAESVDMLRFLEHGVPIRMIHSNAVTYSVDTPADLEVVREKMKSDTLRLLYSS